MTYDYFFIFVLVKSSNVDPVKKLLCVEWNRDKSTNKKSERENDRSKIYLYRKLFVFLFELRKISQFYLPLNS